MITYVPYHDIDKAKYDHCIRHSKASRIYAFSWYLDCVTDCWDVLMEGDYDAVMPLPRKTKYGITYVYTPSWVQQLGLFSLHKTNEKTQHEFLKIIKKKFVWIDYHLNSGYTGVSGSMKIKKNYLLTLEGGFEVIQDNYNKNRKRISKRLFDNLDLDKNGDIEVFMANYKNQDKPYAISDDAVDRLKCLCLKGRQQVHVWNVFHDKEFLAGLVWLEDSQRITYLAPLADEKAKQLHVPTYLINELIKDFQGQQMILDFEGSMVAGVENFYQSFGAHAESYYYVKKRFLHDA